MTCLHVALGKHSTTVHLSFVFIVIVQCSEESFCYNTQFSWSIIEHFGNGHTSSSCAQSWPIFGHGTVAAAHVLSPKP